VHEVRPARDAFHPLGHSIFWPGWWLTPRSSALGLPQHSDQHRPQRPVLLAVDQELGEGAGLLQDPVQVPAVGNAFQFLLSSVLEDEA
jgi:hypothetical protein